MKCNNDHIWLGTRHHIHVTVNCMNAFMLTIYRRCMSIREINVSSPTNKQVHAGICSPHCTRSVVTTWICKRGLSLQPGARGCQVENIVARGASAKITIKPSQPESRTPSLSLSLINWDLGSTWVSLVARFKWLLGNDGATPWVPSCGARDDEIATKRDQQPLRGHDVAL